jgi:S1-C subfamily serine protease
MSSKDRGDPKSPVMAACLLVVLAGSVCAPTNLSAAGDGDFSVDAIQSALNSTVFIEVERSFRGERFTTTGTGFFITADGHILTNNHVVSDWIDVPIRDDWVAVEVNVITIKVVLRPRTPQEKVLIAKVVGLDPQRDLALLKASQPNPDYLELRPDTTVGLLEEVFVLGFPFGEALILDDRGWVSREGGFPEVSINSGRVTSLRRDDSGRVVALQTDAAINPGNSGGPMINSDGELVGVVYAKFGIAQIGFAITPERVWGFLQGQKIHAKFVPSFVTFDRRPVLLKVSGGALLDAAAGGRAVIEGPGSETREFDLVATDNGWRAALEFSAAADGKPADHYIIHVFLEDKNGNPVADHRYRIRRQDQQAASRSDDEGPTRVIDNEMTLSDYARKNAAEQAVDEGIVLPKKHVQRSSSDNEAESAPAAEPTRPEVDLDDLKSRARTYYRGGNYTAAAEIFSQIVRADPDDTISADYLELATERIRLGESTQRTETFDATDVEISDESTTSTAEITTYLHSPAGKGVVDFWLDGEPLPSYTFTARTPEKVFHTFDIQAGEHTFEAELRFGRHSCGRFTFKESFSKDTRWTLRFKVPSKKAEATAYLVERSD